MNYTDKDFLDLCDALVPFDCAFPEMAIHIDRLFYYLLVKTEGIDETFQEFHAEGLRKRKKVEQKTANFTYQELAPLTVILGARVRHAAICFPDIAIHADRVFYEIMNAFKPVPVSFEKFHGVCQRHRLTARVILNTKVRGVG